MDLSKLTKPQVKAPFVTLVGTPGSGKTTLAAQFPAPIFIQAEEVSGVFDNAEEDAKPTLFPILPRARMNKENTVLEVSTKSEILSQIRDLVTQDHEFKTLVIDSVTSLSKLFEHEIATAYGVDNVADAAGGFHKGYLVLAEYHAEIKAACDFLRQRKGMSVVFLAHTGVEKVKNQPDGDEYSTYTLDMNPKSVPVYVNLVDACMYIKQEAFVSGGEKDKKTNRTTKFGRIAQTGKRILVTSGDGKVGYTMAKNRYDLDAEIALPKGENPLLDLIPFFNRAN